MGVPCAEGRQALPPRKVHNFCDPVSRTTVEKAFCMPDGSVPGTLYIVATPIGNFQDLTLRAERILRQVDGVVCEERRAATTLLAHFKIAKPLFELNEHSPPAVIHELIERLEQGENLALISDHGTPLVQDPGADLVRAALDANIRIEPIPGPSAVLAALVASGIPAKRFRFIGQLSPKAAERQRALAELSEGRETLVLLDAPYRLAPLLNALREAFAGERRAAVACNLTMPDERFVRGTLEEVCAHFRAHPFKGEFVVVVQGKRKKS